MIDGVPNPAAPIPIAFSDTAGSSCGALFPQATHGMSLMERHNHDRQRHALRFNRSTIWGSVDMNPSGLEGNATLSARLEQLRLQAGPLMNLGDVREKSVPKMTIVAPPKSGAISTRTFILHRCHKPSVFWAQSALQPRLSRLNALPRYRAYSNGERNHWISNTPAEQQQ